MAERLFVFTISKELPEEKLNALLKNCSDFVNEWTAHQNKLDANCEIHGNRLLLMKVDEAYYRASGCSIDKLNRFVKEQENSFAIELMNRLLVAYSNNGKTEVVHSSKIKELIKDGVLSENTPVYDNTISSSDQFSVWIKPLKETWLKKYVGV